MVLGSVNAARDARFTGRMSRGCLSSRELFVEASALIWPVAPAERPAVDGRSPPLPRALRVTPRYDRKGPYVTGDIDQSFRRVSGGVDGRRAL